MGFLNAFYRNGEPIMLTATDYAVRTGMDFPQARGALIRLVRAGLVKRVHVKFQPMFVLREVGK